MNKARKIYTALCPLFMALALVLTGNSNTVFAVEKGGKTLPIASNPVTEDTQKIAEETISDIEFAGYATTVTFGEESLSGTLVYAGKEGDTSATADILAAYDTFLANHGIEDSIGIVISGTDIEISAPINLPYVEIQADSVWMWEDIYNEDPEDDESNITSKQDRTQAIQAQSNMVYMNAKEISLCNELADTWTMDTLDIFTNHVYMRKTPVVADTFRIVGNSVSFIVEYDDCVLNTVVYDMKEVEYYQSFETVTIDYEGESVSKTEPFTVVSDKVTVTYDANGGECDRTEEEIVTGSIPEKLPVPTRAGYTFDGWFYAQEGGAAVDVDSDIPDSVFLDTIFYAHWTPKVYTVTLVLDEEKPEEVVIENVEYDSLIGFFPTLANEEDPAVIVTGWSSRGEETVLLKQGDRYTVAGDLTLYPVWTDTHCKHEATEVVNEKEAACSEEGYTGDTHCTICDSIIEQGEVIEKTPHQETELKNQRETTCSSSGYTGDQVCKECGAVVEAGEEIAKIPHTYDDGVVTKEPTATEEGQKTYTCKLCKHTRFTILKKSENGKTEEVDQKAKEEAEKAQKEAQEKAAAEKAAKEKAEKEKAEAEQKAKEQAEALAERTRHAKAQKAVIRSVKNQKNKKAVIKLKAVKGCTFQIKVSTSKKFKKNVKTYHVKKASYTAKKLKKGKTYYVKARTVTTINGAAVYGKWSKIKKVKIKK